MSNPKEESSSIVKQMVEVPISMIFAPAACKVSSKHASEQLLPKSKDVKRSKLLVLR